MLRSVLLVILIALGGMLPTVGHVRAAAAAGAAVKPAKHDICKKMEPLGGNIDYVSFKAYWDCLGLITVKKDVPYTESTACKIDSTKTWGYWTSDRRLTARAQKYDKASGQIVIAFSLTAGTKARVSLWVPCLY